MKIYIYVIAILTSFAIVSCEKKDVAKNSNQYEKVNFKELSNNLELYYNKLISTDCTLMRSPHGIVTLMKTNGVISDSVYSIFCFVENEVNNDTRIWLFNPDGYSKSKVNISGKIVSRSSANNRDPTYGFLIHRINFHGENEIENFNKQFEKIEEITTHELVNNTVKYNDLIVSVDTYVINDGGEMYLWNPSKNEIFLKINLIAVDVNDENYRQILKSSKSPLRVNLLGLVSSGLNEDAYTLIVYSIHEL